MKIDRNNPVQLRVMISRRLRELENEGTPIAACEIVLGSETDKILAQDISTMQLFRIDTAAPTKQKIGTLHGGQLDGLPVVVDSATPHLATARRKRRPHTIA